MSVFAIPSDRAELLNVRGNYNVKNVVIPGEIIPKLEEAHLGLREDGPYFILDNFDTYYSVLHNADKLRPDVIYKAYNNLLKATKELNNLILFLFNDSDSLNDELKTKMVNTLKMLIYIFVQFVIHLEEKKRKNQEDFIGKRNKAKKTDEFEVNKSEVLKALNHIMQREIAMFWEPPIVEHDFVGLIAELCFVLLQNPAIKQEKDTLMEIFGIFGNLVKSYDYGKTFVSRLIRTIRMYEHVVHCVPPAIKMIIQQFGCESLIHHFVKEATEWQVDETYQDVQGSRCCSIFLTELAILIPDLILPEVVYLNSYLAHESIPLRISILNVITEIVLNVLTKHDLSEEQKESRDEFLEVIIEHILDTSAVVRAKVIQNLAKLQKENAIPLTFQNEVLSKVIKHLKDKGAAVRKNAINCITTFLEHNPFGANLQLKKAEEQLLEKRKLLETMESTYRELQMAKVEKLEAEWSEIEKDLRTVIEEQIDAEEDEEMEEDNEKNTDEAVEEIRSFLREKKFVEAFNLCRRMKNKIEECKNMKKSEDKEVEIYMTILHSFYLNTVRIVEELRTGAGMTQQDIDKIKTLETVIKYFENTTEFLRIIDSAIEPIKCLLFSQTTSDMHEAIQFFVTAYQFQIDNACEGIQEMLKMMRCNEPDRKNAVVDAFKTIYLITNTKNMTEHTTTILNRLFSLMKDLVYDSLDDFQNIVIEWTSKGILDNAVIDRCWQFYTQRDQVSDEDSRAAADLLRMAAMGRNTIITKNINVVTKIAFSEQRKNDMLFLASSLRLLAVTGLDKIEVQSENPPFRIKHSDEIFPNLANILIENFLEKNPYYSDCMQATFDFIFRVSSNPIEIVTKIIQQCYQKLKESPKNLLVLTRFCECLGTVALKFLGYLDNCVYRELKRINYLREERKKTKKKGGNKRKTKSLVDDSVNQTMNDTVLMGAEAEDADAEFILSVLENEVVSMKGLLGKFFPLILTICQRPDLYDNRLLQLSAVTALMRYMLVSSKFCRDNTQLLFTILEKTKYPDIKCTILVHCADLLIRFPNIVEPWSPRLNEMLKDPLVEVRKKAFFSLANLILKDMIRAHSRISEMAACLIDPEPEVSGMSQNFFERLAQKDNSLVNVLPDIFNHLVKAEDIVEEKLRYVLKFLFDLVDTSKRLEFLVDRFCHKYTPDDNTRLNRNITYCLSLINYNEKALRKLHETFPLYRHHLTDAEIYSTFKQILNECAKTKVGKTDLKPIVTEIENCIASVFELSEEGQPPKRPPVVKSAKKTKPKPRKRSKKTESDEEDSNDEISVPKSAKSSRKRPARTRRSS